jgi:hypothetical protein
LKITWCVTGQQLEAAIVPMKIYSLLFEYHFFS